jgi:hypothetical protein
MELKAGERGGTRANRPTAEGKLRKTAIGLVSTGVTSGTYALCDAARFANGSKPGFAVQHRCMQEGAGSNAANSKVFPWCW